MKLRSWIGHLRRALHCELFQRTVSLHDRGPIVSFTFDDFPRTAFTIGAPILENVGARGTYYVAAGLMNLRNELGELNREEDLQAALERGHELGTQTFGHSSCRSVGLHEFCRDVEKGNEAVERIASNPVLNFAYPYGHVTLRGKRMLGPKLASSRSIIPGLNGPQADLNLLRANKLYGDVENLHDAADLIRENVRRKAWLIFYTHDVRPQPSEYGCTPELFHAVVELAAASASRILTVHQVLAELQPALGAPQVSGVFPVVHAAK